MTMNSKKNPRGVFEKVPGSGEWWARYVDVNGKLRREKAGTKTATIALVEKRRTEVRERLKLPENFRARPASFADLSKDALAYSRARKLSHGDDQCRMSKIVEEFGDRIAEGITPQEIDSWLESHEEWMAATKNRYLALVKLTYRLAEENGKIKANPARLLHMRKENNARVRYLNQYEPLPTNLDYLKSCKDEESRLRAVIQAKYPFHMRELDIALHTGMRRGEQYCTEWANVNFERRMLTVPRSKHGEKRHIPLNAAALAAFTVLPNRATSNFVFLNMRGDDTLQSNRHWFEDAVAAAGIRDFTWHDLRHTFASRLIMVGVDLRTVQELMGHKTIQMTCRYAHLAPAHQLAAVERLLSFSSAADMLTEEMSSGKRKSRNGNKTGNVSGHREIPNSSNSSLSYSLADASTISEPRTAILEQSTDTSTDTEAKGAIETVSDVVQ